MPYAFSHSLQIGFLKQQFPAAIKSVAWTSIDRCDIERESGLDSYHWSKILCVFLLFHLLPIPDFWIFCFIWFLSVFILHSEGTISSKKTARAHTLISDILGTVYPWISRISDSYLLCHLLHTTQDRYTGSLRRRCKGGAPSSTEVCQAGSQRQDFVSPHLPLQTEVSPPCYVWSNGKQQHTMETECSGLDFLLSRI